MKWEIIQDKSKDYILELRGTDGSYEQKIDTMPRVDTVGEFGFHAQNIANLGSK